MLRRSKLLITSAFLILLAIPTWHVASNWAPADPLRFRLVSRTALPDKDGFRYERLDFEVRNTSTAPRRMEETGLKYSDVPGIDPFAPGIFENGTVIPAGGTARGAAVLWWPKEKSPDLGSLEVSCFHASTFRYRLLESYWSLVARLPLSQQVRFNINLEVLSHSIVPLEVSPEHLDAGRTASQLPRASLEYLRPESAP